MNQPLTIVLPLHNRERQLRSSVQDILDMTPTLSQPLQVVVVDDGSTDDTYEAACELARQYPQVTALRQSMQQGLSAALELVRNRLAVDRVLVHDGVSAIDAAQLQTMLQSTDDADITAALPNASTSETSGSRRFSAVRALHDRMEQVHRSTFCFRWMQLEQPLVPRRRSIVVPLAGPEGMMAPNSPIQLANIPLGGNTSPQA